MSFFSIHYLFIINAIILVFLGYSLYKKNKTKSSVVFYLTCLSLALWNVSNALLEEKILTDYIGIFVSGQLLGSMGFANNLFYFSSYYPFNTVGKWNWPNLIVLFGFCIAIMFTDLISDASIVDGEIVYKDGAGFALLVAYMTVLGLSAVYKFVSSYMRYPEQRERIRYFIFGITAFVLMGIACNMVLPSLGNYDYLQLGRLSATIAPLSIFYAMTKHEFMDASVVINKKSSWIVVLFVFTVLSLIVYEFIIYIPLLGIISLLALVYSASVYASVLQKLLLTTAKRKFVRGWYSTEEVFNSLSKKITQEKSREAIFVEIASVLDEVFELENSLSIVAVRDDAEEFSYYKVSNTLEKILATDKLVQEISAVTQCQFVADSSVEVKARLKELEAPIGGYGVIIPFHSPEFLEGLLILGERSSQVPFSDSDIKFFNNLVAFVAPVLYRLTPMEKLEQLYKESRQKLHETEIQLIRAQKVQAIVHATRQCHHEIRTPLNIIRMGMGRVKTLEDLENYKKIAREEIDHALSVVEETLAITEVSEPKERVLSSVDFNDVIRKSLKLIDKSVYHIVLDLHELPPIKAISSDLQVVVINLIHNALDAMPDGGTLAFESNVYNDEIQIVIEDSGVGIPEDMRSKVWEPYVSGKSTQVGNSTAGRGWGLTIVNRIITEHGGTINFNSVENHGTKFIIRLPAQITSSIDSLDDNKRVPDSDIRQASAKRAG